MIRTRTIGIEGLGLAGGRVAPLRVTLREGRIDIDPSPELIWTLAPDEILLPAFHDHHTHLIGTCRPPQGPTLHCAKTRRECLDLIAKWLRENPGDSPVVGEGWDESAWDDSRPPTRAELDSIEDARSVAIRRVCGHLAIVNSAAWNEILPEGDEADAATGTLTESLALGLTTRWPPSFDDLVAGARLGQMEAARAGVVAVDEMARPEQWRAFRSVEESGDLWLRVDHAFPLSSCEALEAAGIRAGDGGSLLRAVGLKGFLDGSFGARTAAIEGHYRDRETGGMLLWEEAPLIDAVRRGSRAGFSIRLHAIGARAIALGVRALEEAVPSPNGAHRIEHAEDLDPGLIERACRAGIAFSMQPNFTARWQEPGGMYDSALGKDRARVLNPYRSVADRGRLLFGSDTMPFGPLNGFPGALRHPDPAQRLDVERAIASYAAGEIASGERADLVVLRIPGGDLSNALAEGTARVLWTAAAGKTVWLEPGASVPEFILECLR